MPQMEAVTRMSSTWHNAGCCCGAPCSDCLEIQDSVVVSTDAPPAGTCDGDGTYAWNTFNDYETFCEWGWLATINGQVWYLWITYTVATNQWGGAIDISTGPVLGEYEYASGSLGCSEKTGELSGVITMIGVANGYTRDCTGYTATITVG